MKWIIRLSLLIFGMATPFATWASTSPTTAILTPYLSSVAFLEQAQLTSSLKPVAIVEKEVTSLRIQSNQLTEQELPPLRTRAIAGDMHAQLLLGLAYQQGCPGAVHDSAEALKWYHLAADQGSSLAAIQIGVFYDPFEMFSGAAGHDPEQALKWYRIAAEQGNNPIGYYNLGELLHQLGKNVEAVRWYRTAMEGDEPMAAIALAELYDYGKVLAGKSRHENWKEAVTLFGRLAAQGNVGAQFVLGRAYREGWLGLPRNPKESFDWFQKAAEQEMPRAVFEVGNCYFLGRGVSKDKASAVKWLQRAASQEDPLAEIWLATLYEKGEVVPKDLVTACTWHVLAEGDRAKTTSPQYLNVAKMDEVVRKTKFHQRLSAAEMEEVVKRVRVWQVEHGRMFY